MLPRKAQKDSGGTGGGRDAGARPPSPAGWQDAVFAAETTHRVANNLSLLVSLVQLQGARLRCEGRGLSADEAAAFLDEVGARIETVARLHRLLSMRPDAPAVDLVGYLGELCDMLALALPPDDTVRLAPPPNYDCNVAPDQILPVALIVNEAVTNAIKYAHPTGLPVRVTIGCRRDTRSALVIEVEDDGVGLPEGLDPEREGGLGFQTMRLLARQLDAELAFHSAPLGLRCTLTLPHRPVEAPRAGRR